MPLSRPLKENEDPGPECSREGAGSSIPPSPSYPDTERVTAPSGRPSGAPELSQGVAGLDTFPGSWDQPGSAGIRWDPPGSALSAARVGKGPQERQFLTSASAGSGVP